MATKTNTTDVATAKTFDPRVLEYAQRIVAGTLDLERVQKVAPSLVDPLTDCVEHLRSLAQSDDPFAALDAVSAPTIEARRHTNANGETHDHYVFDGKRIPLNWIRREALDAIVAAATGDGDSQLAEAIAAAQLAFETGRVVTSASSGKRRSTRRRK